MGDEPMSIADRLRDMAKYLPSAISATEAAALIDAADRIEALEAELARCHYFARVVAGHAEDIKTEAAICIDVVRDGSIGHATGHGPTDPPRPVQRHE